MRGSEDEGRAYRLGLEPLDEDAVEERDDRLDGLERRLGSLRRCVRRSVYVVRASRTEDANHLYEREETRRDETGGEEGEMRVQSGRVSST